MEKRENKQRTFYRLATFSCQVSEFSKDVSVNIREVQGLEFETMTDAKKVANVCKLENYGIYKVETDSNGYCSMWIKDYQQVYVTPDVVEWQDKEKSQQTRDENRKKKAVGAINALPDKVTLYKDDDFCITACKQQTSVGSYHCLDVQYHMKISFKGADVNGWGSYVNSAGQIQKRKFARDMFEREHEKLRQKQGWQKWEITLNTIPKEYTDKMAGILSNAVLKLRSMNDNIVKAKSNKS